MCRYKIGESEEGDLMRFAAAAAQHRRTTLTRRSTLAYARKVGRIFSVCVALCVAALLVGYDAGSRRTSTLETFLDHLTIEYDALRGLAAEQAYQLDRITDVRLTEVDSGELDRVRAELDQTLAFLNEARSSADDKTKIVDERVRALEAKALELRECGAVQGRLESQLESCIFEKASLERSAPAPQADARPRSGVSNFSQSLDFPATDER